MFSKRFYMRMLLGAAFLLLSAFHWGCGEDAGLYNQENIVFENNHDPAELDLDEESSEFGSFYGFYGALLEPWPIFEYYNNPLPVLVPVNPYTNIIEWIHPMYVDQYLSGEFGPRDF
jgi:hypothetical protein